LVATLNTTPPVSRQKLEMQALQPFIAAATDLGLQCCGGQGLSNRVPLKPNVYFQFGDLRVELPTLTIIVEVESSGGVTNLAKYWESFDSGRISKPIKLLHLFRQKSVNDYEAHLIVWRFLSARMQAELAPKFYCEFSTYRDGAPEKLAPALAIFRQWLHEAAA